MSAPWQPRSTAPRDGSWFVVRTRTGWGPSFQRVVRWPADTTVPVCKRRFGIFVHFDWRPLTETEAPRFAERLAVGEAA